MDSIWTIIATIVTAIGFACSTIGFLYIKMVKNPHDIEEQYNRKIQEEHNKHFTKTLDTIEKNFSSSTKEFRETTALLSKSLQEISKSRERFEVKLDKCEEKLETHDRQIEELRHYHMEQPR